MKLLYILILNFVVIRASAQVDELSGLGSFKLLGTKQQYINSNTLEDSEYSGNTKSVKMYNINDNVILNSLGFKFDYGTLFCFNDLIYSIDFVIIRKVEDFNAQFDLGIAPTQLLYKKLVDVFGPETKEDRNNSLFYSNRSLIWVGSKNKVILTISEPNGNTNNIFVHLELVNIVNEQKAELSKF